MKFTKEILKYIYFKNMQKCNAYQNCGNLNKIKIQMSLHLAFSLKYLKYNIRNDSKNCKCKLCKYKP